MKKLAHALLALLACSLMFVACDQAAETTNSSGGGGTSTTSTTFEELTAYRQWYNDDATFVGNVITFPASTTQNGGFFFKLPDNKTGADIESITFTATGSGITDLATTKWNCYQCALKVANYETLDDATMTDIGYPVISGSEHVIVAPTGNEKLAKWNAATCFGFTNNTKNTDETTNLSWTMTIDSLEIKYK